MTMVNGRFHVFTDTLVSSLFARPFILYRLRRPVSRVAAFLASNNVLSTLTARVIDTRRDGTRLRNVRMPLITYTAPANTITASNTIIPKTTNRSFVIAIQGSNGALLATNAVSLCQRNSDRPFSDTSVKFKTGTHVTSVCSPRLTRSASTGSVTRIGCTLRALKAHFTARPLMTSGNGTILTPNYATRFHVDFTVPRD